LLTDERAEYQASKHGYQAGRQAGASIITAHTTETQARAIIDGYDNGNDDVLGLCRTPDHATILDELGDDAPRGHAGYIVAAYETAYFNGFWSELLRAARARYWSHVLHH
jgi:hypothetical protein